MGIFYHTLTIMTKPGKNVSILIVSLFMCILHLKDGAFYQCYDQGKTRGEIG